jgi:hypothetical protein
VPGLSAHCVPLDIDEPPLEPPKNHQQASGAREAIDCRVKITAAFEQAGRLPPDTGRVEVWAAQGYDLTLCASVVAEGLARNSDIGSLKYFDRRLADVHQRRAGNGSGHVEPAEKPTEEALWRRMWPIAWGPAPDVGGFEIPKELIAKWTAEEAEKEKA